MIRCFVSEDLKSVEIVIADGELDHLHPVCRVEFNPHPVIYIYDYHTAEVLKEVIDRLEEIKRILDKRRFENIRFIKETERFIENLF